MRRCKGTHTVESESRFICDTYSGQSSSDMSGHECVSGRTYQQCPSHGRTRLFKTPILGMNRVYNTLTVIVTIVLVSLIHTTSASVSYDDADRWYSQREGEMVKVLGNYGYIKDASQELGPSGLTSRESYIHAVKLFQKWGNIPQTGIIDSRTHELMNKPRCGNKDIIEEGGPTMIRTRRKRYVTAPSKWEKQDLTFLIRNTTPDLSAATVHRVMRDAFNVWSEVCPLTFTQVFNQDADILIQFATGFHQDGYPFDGKGSVLAHAFFPGDDKGGDTHFDEAETWTFNSTEGVDLFMVATHEFGHALGLAHSSNTEALMYPWYQGYTEGFKLPYDDVQGIQSLYGSKTGGPIPTSRPYVPDVTRRPNERPDDRPKPPTDPDVSPCTHSIDALTVVRTEIFVFIGPVFWRLGSSGIRGEPTEISKFWYGLPEGGVDAVYERGDSKIVFFKGDRFWVFSSNYLVTNFPKEGRRITELGIDEDVKKIDAVFVWNYNKRTYLITGDMYWKLNEKDDFIEYDYPRDMSIWAGVPVPVDSAFQSFNGKNYFLKENEFWEFYDTKMKTRKKKGTDMGKLLGCKDGKLRKDVGALIQGDSPSSKQEVSYNNVNDSSSSAPYIQIFLTNLILLTAVLHSLH